MALIPYEPFRIFGPLWNEMDRMFMRRGKEDLSEWLYRVDVEETPTKVVITAEIPCIESKEDLNIQVNENILTIHGEVKRFNIMKNVHQDRPNVITVLLHVK